METILEAKQVSKSFVGVQALKDITIQIKQGEIHCLAGENGCGKSTLVKCFSGVYVPDGGKIIVNGKNYDQLTPTQAMREGIQVIYQDLSLFPHLTVEENIAIGKLKNEKAGLLDWRRVRKIAKEHLNRIGVQLDLEQPVEEISMANRQIVAICRALAQECKILFMDEPTTALTKTEVDRLLNIMVELKKRGMSIVFISHKLDEVFSVADVITIFRNGEKIGDFKSEELDKKSLSYYMTGREVEYPRYERKTKNDTPVLEVEHLTRNGQFQDISFSLRSGDILGVTGLLGAGRTELALSLFGLNPSHSGIVKVEGKECKITSPIAAKKYGIALLPEDRSVQGLFMNRMIMENVSSAIIKRLVRKGRLDKKEERKTARQFIQKLKVRTPSEETIIGTLSGGNQQKAVIGKWLATQPKIFIMDTPTVGIDIGSKAEIYEQIHRLAEEGMAIILISDEVQEILANCNRVMILADGKCSCMLEEEDLREKSESEMEALIGQQKRKEAIV